MDRCDASAQAVRKTASSSAVLFCPGLSKQGDATHLEVGGAICSALSIDLNGELLQKCHQRCIQIISVFLMTLWVFFVPVKLTIK